MKLDEFRFDGKEKFKIADCKTTCGDAKDDKDKIKQKTLENLTRIAQLQEQLYADGREGLIFCLQARDAAGKDSTIKHVMASLNPQGVDVYSFKAPNSTELSHDFLWRIVHCLPARGKIAIFNRSHYEDVLVVRVHHLDKTYKLAPRCVDDDFFTRRYAHIKNFEEYLYDNGYRMIKIFLNVSREEQKKRLLERLDRPEKNWKFDGNDLKERALWDEYNDAYEDAINKTATKDCPWYVVPADDKWYTRYVVSEILKKTLEDMAPRYPELSDEEKASLPEYKKQLENE